jgi:hypothetical protein
VTGIGKNPKRRDDVDDSRRKIGRGKKKESNDRRVNVRYRRSRKS